MLKKCFSVVYGKTWVVKRQLQQMLVILVSCGCCSIYEHGSVHFHQANLIIWKKKHYSMPWYSHRDVFICICMYRCLSVWLIYAYCFPFHINHPNMCFSTRYLEWAVIPDRPWPASRMEEDHRHGWYLLLAHSYRHHPVGEACHPPCTPWTDRVPGPGWPHSLNTT